MLNDRGDLDLRWQKGTNRSRIPWLTTLLGVLGFSFLAGLFLWWRVGHHDSAAKMKTNIHHPTMESDPLSRCQMTKEEYTIRNGKAALRPNRRRHREEACQLQPQRHTVVPATAECPFLIAVYRPGAGVYDIVSNAIRVQGFWEPRESGIIEDLPQDSFFVDIGANIGWYSLLALSLGHRVLAFEPMRNNVELLRQSLCLNPGLGENLELHEVALSENTDCILGSNSQNAGDGVLLCDENVESLAHDQRSHVKLQRLDAFLTPGMQVDLLKVASRPRTSAILPRFCSLAAVCATKLCAREDGAALAFSEWQVHAACVEKGSCMLGEFQLWGICWASANVIPRGRTCRSTSRGMSSRRFGAERRSSDARQATRRQPTSSPSLFPCQPA